MAPSGQIFIEYMFVLYYSFVIYLVTISTGPGGNTPIHICCSDSKKFEMLRLLASKGLNHSLPAF